MPERRPRPSAPCARSVPRDANDLPAWGAAWRTADFLLDPAAGFRVAAVMTEPGRDAQSRLLGHTTRAHMQMARGRWRDARAQADSAARIDPDYAARTWAFLAGFFPGDLPRDEVAARVPPAGRDRAARRPRHGRPRGRGARALSHGAAPVPAGRARRAPGGCGGDGAARGRAGGLEDTTAAGRFARHLRHQLRRARWRPRGTGRGALRTVEAGWPAPVPDVFVKDDSYSTVAERYFRAQLLARAGRDREALAWFGSLTEDISRAIVFPVVAEAEQGRVLERMGRPREAAIRYARFADRWRDADPEAAARVRDARERRRAR